jgi:hypothetical protein
MFVLAVGLMFATSACTRNAPVQNGNAQNSGTVSKNAANEPAVNWAEGNLIIDGQTFKLNHAYASLDSDPFSENKYTIRVLLSEQPISKDVLDDHTALMNMKKDANSHAMEVDIDEQHKVTWIGLWGLGQVSGMDYPFEPAVFNNQLVEGRLFTAKAETVFDKKWQYDVKFKSSVRVDPYQSFVTASTGRPLAADGGEAGKAYLDYQAAIRTAKGPGDLDRFYSKPVLKDRNANPELKELAMEMEKGSLLEDIKIVGGFIDGEKATLSVEGKREGESNLRGKVNLHLEDGQWKIGAQAFRGGNSQ